MRKLAIFATAVLAVSTLAVGTAGATAPPPLTGTISCTMAGTLSLNHPLSNTAGTKAIKIKGSASGTSCNTTGTSGGKFPVSGITVKLGASLPVGATCASLTSPTFTKNKVQVKFLGLNPSNKLATVAVDNTTIATAALTSASPVVLTLTTAPITKGGFVGQTLSLNVGLDTDAATLLADCATGITSLAFGNTTPSSVTSP